MEGISILNNQLFHKQPNVNENLPDKQFSKVDVKELKNTTIGRTFLLLWRLEGTA